MTVSAQPPISRSTGNGVTTVFPYTFKIISDGDIEVSIDDVIKTLNVDYTVSGAGLDAGGDVTMTTAPAVGTTVVRRRDMAIVRSTDYQDQGTLPAATLDLDIDSTVLMMQQLDERLGRTFSLPASFSGVSAFPAPAAGYLLGWDALGKNLTNLPASVGTSLIDLAASSGSSLVGFIQSGAGAVATTVQGKLRTDLPTVTDVGMLAANGAAQNTAAIGNALVSNSNKTTLVIPAGTFQLSPEINLGIYKRIVGAGRDQTVLQFEMNTATAAFLIDQYCSIEGVTIENIGTDTTGSSACCSYSPGLGNGWANGAIKDCRILNFGHAVAATVEGSSPFTASLTRSQAFNTKIWNNIFQGCAIPIYLGVGANCLSIKGDWFNGTTGNRNIVLNSCLQPTIEPDNAFQGVAAGGFDIDLTGCISPKVGGYFEPAYGIYADSCPGLSVDQCILNGFAASKTAFVVTTNASNAGSWNYPLPIKSSVENITLFSSGYGKYCVQNAATSASVMTLTDNISSQGNDWTINGLASYPKFEEGTFTATLSAAGGAPGAYTDQYGFYQQRGKQISVSFRVGAAKGTMSGAVSIAGLPKAATSRTLYNATAALAEAPVLTLAAGYTQVAGEIGASGSSIVLTKIANNGASAAYVLASEMGASPFFVGSIVYEVA